MEFKEALHIAAKMTELPYNDLMRSSLHPDIINRIFNLAREIQKQYEQESEHSKQMGE